MTSGNNQLEVAFALLQSIRYNVSKDGIAININSLRKSLDSLETSLSDALASTVSPTGHPDQQFGAITYAQHGDDLMLLNLFKLMGIERPSYLDLGAHDPFVISNTALLYARGSRGVNVEANPVLYERFVKLRPEDTNVNIGVGQLRGTGSFHMYSDTSGRNTFSDREVKSLEGVMQVQKSEVLPIKTLQDIVLEHCKAEFPDLLSCDIEGLDFEVLSTLPKLMPTTAPNKLPKVICVETRRHETMSMRRMLMDKGFHLHVRMGENLIFVRSDYIQLLF